MSVETPEKQLLRTLGDYLREAKACLEKIEAGDTSNPWRPWCATRLLKAGEICRELWPTRTFTQDLLTMAQEAEEADPTSLKERLWLRMGTIAGLIREQNGQRQERELGEEDDRVTVVRLN